MSSKRCLRCSSEAAWAVFDINGDHKIAALLPRDFLGMSMRMPSEEDEWVSVAESCSYFGPILPIFRFLDKDDEATFSRSLLR